VDDDGGEEPDAHTRSRLAPGTKVDVRNRFQGTWVRGFEIAEVTSEGYRIRRIYDLPLRRSEQPVFLFGWSLMHVIDDASPLAGASAESLKAARAYLLLTIAGTDETTGQMLMSRQEYSPASIHWNHAFADIFKTGEDGVDRFDYTKFHEVLPLG